MPRKQKPQPVRGVFEKPKGSGVWWINYVVKGVRHREKVGSRDAATKLYQKRKTHALEGRKMPELRPGAAVTLSDLMADAVEYAKVHNATWSDYECKQKIIDGDKISLRPANEITPKELAAWISKHCNTASTANRYRSFFSLCYREGGLNGKAEGNPARLVRPQKENNARLRYLSRGEFDKMVVAITRDNPDQLPAFIVSIFTGMRRSEQFGLVWSQVDLKRKVIRLTKTKNGSARNVPLNGTALAAVEAQRRKVAHFPNAPVFPRPGRFADHRWWFNPALKEAGVTGYTWHGNRHTFCSWAALAGVSLKEIQVLAGHKSITMTARYAHLSPDAAVSASERIVAPVAA